jgi:hypothetical protein
VFYADGAPLPVDVRGLVVSEGALIDSLHQAQASGALQAGANTRDHVRFIENPKGDLAPQSCIWTITTANDDRPGRSAYREIETQ